MRSYIGQQLTGRTNDGSLVFDFNNTEHHIPDCTPQRPALAQREAGSEAAAWTAESLQQSLQLLIGNLPPDKALQRLASVKQTFSEIVGAMHDAAKKRLEDEGE